jgi:hypothetical protein
VTSSPISAATVLADLIDGRPTPWAALYDSTRVGTAGQITKAVSANVPVARHLVGDRLARLVASQAQSLGDGDVVKTSEGTVAAFRDPDGVLHAVDATCAHLGCTV